MVSPDVDEVAVLGAGTMGHGIAEVAALAGYAVTLRDIDEALVERGRDNLSSSLDRLVDRGDLTRTDADAALDRVDAVVDIEDAVTDADVVVEAVPERMAVKESVYEEVCPLMREGAVLATNTSSFSITDLSEATDRPERFVGLHFFNPPVRMALVEVIRGAHTSDETVEFAESLAASMDKTPVRVRKDSPGFVVNRVLIPLLNEGAWLLDGDEASMDAVDASAAVELGLPMGVFELTDYVGVDVTLDVLEYMHETLGDAYEPCPLLREKVEAEALGRKTGRGFYDYDDGGATYDEDAADPALGERFLAVMANETAKLVGDDVAPASDVDTAMRLGAGFPEGPATMADDAGLSSLRDRLVSLHEQTGAARYEPAPHLVTLADAGASFDDAN